ncbi:MAG TPA: hypothetical protein VGO18_18295, partial [Steroidobacteraceae bacterium]|nr:hypothetical protein [Steroidobacteraceae bacterium]
MSNKNDRKIHGFDIQTSSSWYLTPLASTCRSTPQTCVLSVRHYWFGSRAAKENQMEPTTIAIDLAKRVFLIH